LSGFLGSAACPATSAPTTACRVTGNTLAIAVRERTREFAIFKAFGFSDFTLLAFVMAESLVPALLGGTLDLGLAWIGMPVVAKLLNGILPNLVLSSQILIFGLLMALLFGMVSGLIPGIIAMRMRVIKALRAV
jgi:putative ABC transport system permease protein